MYRRRQVGLHPFAASAITVFALLFPIGCVSVDPQPFADFSGSVKELRSGADSALEYIDAVSRTILIQRIVDEVESGETEALLSLRLGVQVEEPLELDLEEVPSFLKSRWFREGVFALNTTVVDYAELLHQLAQPGLLSEETFNEMAKDLNGNVAAAMKALNQDVQPRDVALFSTAAAGLIRSVLENQRRSELSKAIASNQTAIEAIALCGRNAVQIAAVEMAENYRDNSQEVLRRIGLSPAKQTLVEHMVRLDDDYIARLATLRTLDKAYAALPKAHDELMNAVKNPSISLASIQSLYEQGKRLHQLYAELAAAGATPE